MEISQASGWNLTRVLGSREDRCATPRQSHRECGVLPLLACVLASLVVVVPGAVAEGGRVEGVVTGPGAEPLAGYRVQLVEKNAVRATSRTTGRRGRFKLTGFSSGAFEIRVLGRGGVVCGSELLDLELMPSTRLDLTIRLNSHPCVPGSGISLPSQSLTARSSSGRATWWILGGLSAGALVALAGGDDNPREAPVSPAEP